MELLKTQVKRAIVGGKVVFSRAETVKDLHAVKVNCGSH